MTQPTATERATLAATEQALKADYVSGTIARPAFIARLSAIHAAIAALRGVERCGCGACREVRAQ